MMNALVGFLTGVLASMGLGGGFVLVVWLTLAQGMEQRRAQGINILFFLPIAFIAIIMHLKSGLVKKPLVKSLALGGVFGAVVGTLCVQIIPNELLKRLYAVFLLAFGLREIFSKPAQSDKT